MLAVMYHYVRPNTDRPPYEYYYLDLDDFKRQLDYFEAEYELIDRGTFLSYVAGEAEPSANDAILTFDDGLRDHYEWVLPELRKRNLWGLFFVPGPIGETLLPVHRIHSMLGSADPSELADALEEVIDRNDIRKEKVDEFEQIYAQYSSSDNAQQFKRTLNYLVPYDRLPGIFDDLEDRISGVDRIDPSEYYMTREQIRELSDAGMLLGGHTVTHPALSRLSPASQREEIQQSLEFVQDVVEQPIQTFAYPYGGEQMYNETTVEVLQDAGCDLAFTTKASEISSEIFRTKPLELPRRDCNEFKHGEASIS